ncbi:putative UDP-glucuronosyltransferase [Daphnia pulex]|uniref:UDP-glucuronosyltransferase n=1 Tax=Daphnia pulex TaxID=6669 RepID=E9HIT3_DAPPU|nr:UDP-glycosyltransferase 210B1 [Daphnia pulex]EFX68357.1 putative UDP-glucuronosyltransferase [Daphnia pulex]|eukprot:EFX68357.1 putative UDP-glucuronosyltransferase [Daphnia pulex]
MSFLPARLSVFFVLIGLASCHNILVFMPFGSHSHKATLIPLIQGLLERNHSVTFITNQESTDLRYHKMMYNLDEVVVPNLNYSMLDPESAEQNFFEIAAKQSIRSQLKIFSHLSGQVNRVLDQTYSDAGVQSVLRHGQFDLLLLSQVVSYAGYPMAWHFQCPFILSSPNVLMTDSAYLLGDSEHTEYVPFFLMALTDQMNLVQRVINTVVTHLLNFYQDMFVFPRLQPAIEKYFPGAPSLIEMKANITAAFANTHPAFSYPRAYPPGVVELGGIHCRPAKPLPHRLEQFVAESGSAGFIVFGVGSIIPMDEMPREMLDVFIRVFSRLPQRVVWQWRGFNKPANLSDNILLVDWLPQQDLLGHEKCRLFLTHGGLLSTQEAIYHGVPVLGLPFISDQLLNMDKAVRDGYALQLRWNEIQDKLLHRTIHELIYQNSYVENVRRRQSLLLDQSESPLERGLYWAEYIARHGGAPHLQLGSRHLNRFQRSLVDVYLILAAIACLLIFATWRCLGRFEFVARLTKLDFF